MPQNHLTSINSKYFIDRVENDIVQLTKTLSIEHSISIDEAKLMARQITQRRLNGLLTKDEKDGIDKISTAVKEDIKNFNFTAGRILDPKLVYELLKTFELI